MSPAWNSVRVVRRGGFWHGAGMRWQKRKYPSWSRRFAFWPVSDGQDVVWLQLYWYRWGGDCGEVWFEERPPYA